MAKSGHGGTLGVVRMNSPMEGSSVKQDTSWPTDSTRQQEEPYMQYPAATISRPGCTV